MQDSGTRAREIRSILISGAGAAGQSLAYWLRRYGFAPTVIERAPAPRRGGFAIDLRGAAVTVAERMGIVDDCRAARVRMREIIRIDRRGGVAWKSDGNFGGGAGLTGDVEILRDDLTSILQNKTSEGVDYIFGDTITAIAQDDGGVTVTFKQGPPRRFDLVIGADGLHSTVRALAFGSDDKFLRPLGYYAAIFSIPNLLDIERQWLMHYLPGKMANYINYGPDKHTRALFIFASPPLTYDRTNIAQQKALIRAAFEHETSWEIPRLLGALEDASDLYFDDVTQVRMDHWSMGRVALLGDAAFAPTLITGQGSSLAVVGAYVLAGELKAADGDYHQAFAHYEQEMHGFVAQNQRIALECPELVLLESWEALEQREAQFRAQQDLPDAGVNETSAAYFMQSAANAISLKNYG